MKKVSRQMLVCAFMLIFLSSACGALGQPASPQDGSIPTNAPGQGVPDGSANSGQAPGIAVTPLIPITGENVASMQCQFCVNNETYAVLVFPDFAYFDVVSATPVRCSTANVVNGRRILICRGTPSMSFSLNICADNTNCLQFPVTLQPCSLLQGGSILATPFSPFALTPVNPSNNQNPNPPANTALPQPPSGNAPATPSSPLPVEPTDPAPPTDEPSPTDEPPPPPPPTQVVNEDVVICHIPPGNPENQKTMTVSLSAWRQEHSRHGDSMGAC